jgi:hypothetical protein
MGGMKLGLSPRRVRGVRNLGAHKKGPSTGPFVLKPKSLGQPGLNGRGAVLHFPFLQRFVIAAFGFDDPPVCGFL